MIIAARFRGLAALYASAVLFAFTSLSVKLASAGFAGTFISATRFAIGTILSLALVVAGRRGLGGARKLDWFLRGFFGAVAMAAMYVAIALTGPGRATVLTNVYPVFVTLFGVAFFGEKVSGRTLSSLALATAGAIIVMRDGSGANLAGDLLALGGAVLGGVAVNYVRRASKAGCDPFVLYLSPSLLGLPLFLFAPLPVAIPGTASLVFLFAAGIGAFLAQALMATGYRTVPAGRGSIVFYAETGLTVLLGVLLTGERFTVRFAVGLVLIALGLWINSGRSGRPVAADGRMPAGGMSQEP
ncbi:MAG: DMT family transporter [Spirochaetales bacterium]|nr:MAG: DMT family transporter [Spirochaetales bacterium]